MLGSSLTRTPIPWVVVLLLIAGYQLGLRNATNPPKPTAVGMVDLKKLIDNLNIRAGAEEQVRALAEKLDEQSKGKLALADQFKEDLKALVPGTEKFIETEEKWRQATIDAKTFFEYAKLKIDARAADNLLNVYEKVKTAAGQFATANGYDLILVDDSKVKMERGTPDVVLQQISARRALFAADVIDITNDLITWMNAMPK